MTNGNLDVLILRDPRESKAKCSLTPIRGLERIEFVESYPDRRVPATGRLLLHAEGPELSPTDLENAPAGLLLIDCSWRRVEKLLRTVDGDPVRRRLPELKTAYPRRSKTFEDPNQGLASIEALYAGLSLLGNPRPELLIDYRWREQFLAQNALELRLG